MRDMNTVPNATRAAALAALEDFLPQIPAYAARRGFVTADLRTVSRLSPYLRRRVITENEVVTRVLAAYSFQVAEKFVQEVVWRTYWKGWLERNPGVWTACVAAEARYLDDIHNSAWGEAYLQACRGETRLSFFNDWVKELVDTGYLHNHVRMWYASVWIFTLRLPWQLGAMFMYRHLLDGDPASNTLSWRWVAGLQTKGKSYLARADNIATYSEGRWQPQPRELAEEALKILEETSGECSIITTKREYGAVPSEPYGVLTTGEDLSVEQNPEIASRAVAIAVLESDWIYGESKLVADFSCAAERDAVQRLCKSGGVGVTDSEGVVSWAETHRLSRVVIVAPAVGPNVERVARIVRALEDEGIEPLWYQRPWDSHLHGLADKGFFPFWERVKKRIERGDPLFHGKSAEK